MGSELQGRSLWDQPEPERMGSRRCTRAWPLPLVSRLPGGEKAGVGAQGEERRSSALGTPPSGYKRSWPSGRPGPPKPSGTERKRHAPCARWRRTPGRALGPGRRTCWLGPGLRPPVRPPPGVRDRRGRGGSGGASGGHRPEWRRRRSAAPGSPWPSCCGACRIPSSSPASSAAAGSSLLRMKGPGRTARTPWSARRGSSGSSISPLSTARAAGPRPMGCAEPRRRR